MITRIMEAAVRYRFRHIEREFSPKEVAEITSVSARLQRDWRRRKLLPEREGEGWSVFSLKDVIQIMAMKVLSESGIALGVAQEIASLSVLPTLGEFRYYLENYSFEGAEVSDDLRDRVMESSVVGASGRYLLVPLPPQADLVYNVRRGDDLTALAQGLPSDRFHYLILDHQMLAEKVMAAVKGPLYRILAEEIAA